MEPKTTIPKFFFLCFLLCFDMSLDAHSGGLDSSGGHLDKSTGHYHCHSVECQLSTVSTITSSYSRENWRHWIDSNGDCQDTRAELLISNSRVEVEFRDIDNCIVESGEWLGPYSGNVFRSARDIDIDHVIPLNYASKNGGISWSKQKKEAFANDPINLLAVSSTENRKKGAKGPSQYLPNRIYQCAYVKKWLDIAAKYELALASEDIEKITEVVTRCE